MEEIAPAPPPTITYRPLHGFVTVPHVAGMLRPETEAAVTSWGGGYSFITLPPDDPHAYARVVTAMWCTDQDLVFVEQDIVPAPGMIEGLFACERPWCGHPYHVGEGRYTWGLGLCKISKLILKGWPGAASLAMRDHRGRAERMEWPGVNEALDRQLRRYGIEFHLHSPAVPHLHYPVDQ